MGLSYKVPPLVFNFRQTKNLLFLYFAISRIFWTSNWLGILTALIFYHEKHLKWEEPRGQKEPRWCGPLTSPCHQGSFCPQESSHLYLFMDAFISTKKGHPIFSHNFLRRQRKWKPSSTSRRADLLLPKGNYGHHHHRLLLGIGGGGSSITSSSASSSSPTTAPSPPQDLTSSPS
jgi:hypothetical protein